LTYDPKFRSTTSIEPDSPVLSAHNQLTQERELGAKELTAFGVLASVDKGGPLLSQDGIDPLYISQHSPSVDARVERVTQHQYLKLAIVRRDASYEMCGTRGVVVLSGNGLAASTTREAVGPIRRRLFWWFLSALGIGIAAHWFSASLQHPGAYFEHSNLWTATVSSIGALLAILVAGAILREYRPGFRFGRLATLERALGLGALVGFAAAGAITFAARPRAQDVALALAAGDLSGAGRVADALKVTLGPTPDALDAEDSVVLAQAQGAIGDAKLEDLDRVAARNGAHAKEAAQQARAERIKEISSLLKGNKPAAVLTAMDRWYQGSWKGDAELSELRARADDTAFALCGDDVCRLTTASAAQAAAATTTRLSRATNTRNNLLLSLSFSSILGEPLLARVQRLHALCDVATKVMAIADDSELLAKAQGARDLATIERAKVPLLGADDSVVGDLLGSLTNQSPKIAMARLDGGVSAYITHDGLHHCSGLYAVGASKDARALSSQTWPAERILSQAVGHPATLRKPTGTSTTSRWIEGPFPVVARWNGGALIELRIADAAP
jgi:hypothetical protein